MKMTILFEILQQARFYIGNLRKKRIMPLERLSFLKNVMVKFFSDLKKKDKSNITFICTL